VETELSICEKLARFPVPDSVWEEFVLDQEINDRGVALDRTLVRQALIMDTRSQAELTERLKVLTGLENPNSVVQMKRWLSDHGLTLPSLGKSEVQASMMTAPPELQEVLMLRQQLARSSVKKYQAMESAVCADGRARGMFQFFGSRTGRWTGRLIQLQNLPQNRMQDLEQARDLVRQGAYETLKMLYGDVPDILSQLVRTAFVPQEGRKLIVADFSSVEARILAWYAGEGWRQEVFRRGEDLYCASASQMFRCRVEKHGQNAELRQKGKISELALGFGGSVGALRAMGAVELGLREDELQPLVDRWRSSNPAIVRFWRDVDQAAIQAVRMHSESSVAGVRFRYRSGMLLITLPSGRSLCYIRPAIGINRFGGECITYEGLGSTRKWERLETFGAKLVENIVQATARDLLCHAMQTLRGCRIVMHIHDELVIEADRNLTVQDVCDNMSQTPSWAEGLLLAADGFETEFYRKG
jgi:DNA polymerase